MVFGLKNIRVEKSQRIAAEIRLFIGFAVLCTKVVDRLYGDMSGMAGMRRQKTVDKIVETRQGGFLKALCGKGRLKFFKPDFPPYGV